MDNEDKLRRPPPPRPYRATGLQLGVPRTALQATLTLLQQAGRKESGVFWYGPRDSAGNGTVAYVVAPQQRMTFGNYNVSAQAMARIVHGLPDDWRPLAQIHSHPGVRVEHSNYDDRMMSSRRAISLVFPNYGRASGAFPDGVGIHEWQDEYWHLLDPRQAAQRVVIGDGAAKVEDFR